MLSFLNVSNADYDYSEIILPHTNLVKQKLLEGYTTSVETFTRPWRFLASKNYATVIDFQFEKSPYARLTITVWLRDYLVSQDVLF